MPELLFELFSEEIPARMQMQAAADLKRLVTDALVARGLLYEGAVAHVTPRRLVLHVAGLPARQPDRHEEKKGPRVGAPQAALDGFLKSAGLTTLDQAEIVTDPKKGQFYVAKIAQAGAPTLDVLADILPGVVKGFPWPKSMRWGAGSTRVDALRWVRPLHAILATFGPETEEPEIVPFAVDGIAAGNVTFGHRFMAPREVRVRRFDDYVPALDAAKVVVDADRRRDIILHDAKDLAFAQGLELIEDERLLEEVAGLVEWPVVLMGSFDPAFLAIPPEVIRATIRVNQKCFVLRDAHPSRRASGAPQDEDRHRPHGEEAQSAVSNHEPQVALAPNFILVSNIVAKDGGAAIVAGNQRVVAARLADAKFFWDSDLKVALADRLPKLDKIVFHEKLGTQGERVKRIAALARELAPLVGADPVKAFRAATLCKADLVSEMVGEFPELQGLMGRYYAQHQGEDASVATAIEDHYRPQGPGDRVPTDPVAIAVALADKIDTLVGFWAIDEKPTGSKDPYALRRAALGVIRIVVENKSRCELLRTFSNQLCSRLAFETRTSPNTTRIECWLGKHLVASSDAYREKAFVPSEIISEEDDFKAFHLHRIAKELVDFFADRLKVYLRDKGARHDLIDAAMGATPPSPLRGGAGGGGSARTLTATYPNPARYAVDPHREGEGGAQAGQGGQASSNDDLLMIVRRVEALAKLLDSDDGKNLLAGYKRAANILRAEEKKDGAGAFEHSSDASKLAQDEERALHAAIDATQRDVGTALSREDFAAAMSALAKLRAPVDAFFEKVTVNADDSKLRVNRLRLLASLRRVMHEVADFSKVAG